MINILNIIIFLLIIFLIIILAICIIKDYNKSYFGGDDDDDDEIDLTKIGDDNGDDGDGDEFEDGDGDGDGDGDDGDGGEFENGYEFEDEYDLSELTEFEKNYLNNLDISKLKKINKQLKKKFYSLEKKYKDDDIEENYDDLESKKNNNIKELSHWLRMSKNKAILILTFKKLKDELNKDNNKLYFIPDKLHLSTFHYNGNSYTENQDITINDLDRLPNGTFYFNYDSIVI